MDVAGAVGAALGSRAVAAEPLAGGMVGAVARVELADGRAVVAKTSARNDLRVEAYMLRLLRERGPLPVPEVLSVSRELLVLELLPGRPGAGDAAAQRHLAELLAATHAVRGEAFGLERDTLLGPCVLPNARGEDGVAFFRDRRLRWALGLARGSGALPEAAARRVEAVAERLPALLAGYAPAPSLLHGDLWSGNVLTADGRVTGVLDPAAHFGDAETELAFVDLFGGVGEAFWARYGETRPIEDAFFAWRRSLWQLVPLLVHVALFGRGYVGPLEARLRRVEERF